MKWYEKAAEAGKKLVKRTIEVTHIALDVAGLIPAAGAIPDLIYAGIYALEGDWKNFAFSAVAAVPLIGDAAGVCKILKRIDGAVDGAKLLGKAMDAMKGIDLLPMIEKLYPLLNGLMGKLGKLFDQFDIPEPLRKLMMKLFGDSAELVVEGGILFSKLSMPDQLNVLNMLDNINDFYGKDPKGNGKGVTVLKETDKFIDYVNASGKTVRVPKQSPTNIVDSINQKLKSTDSGTKIEAKVADYVSKNTNAKITDFGNKVKTPTGEIIGDIDCGTVNELIEVKKSISSVKVKQCDKYVNVEVSDYLNVENKKVIMYIDEPVDMSNIHNINKINQLKEKGVIVVNSLEELKGVIQ